MTDRNIFIYGETEVSYLKKRDKKLAEVMEKVGPIEREVIPDLFAALVNSIIGQQISTKAHKTIWKKMVTVLGEITPQVIDSLSDEELQQFGITFKKVVILYLLFLYFLRRWEQVHHCCTMKLLKSKGK